MRILELFMGTGSFARAALDLGHEVTGVDIEPCPEDLVGKIEYYQADLSRHRFTSSMNRPWEWSLYDFVWASPPCNTFSTRGWNRSNPRRIDCKAVTDEARHGDRLAQVAIYHIIQKGRGVLENPRACMRKQDYVRILDRITVTYCQYGHDRMKPTDLFFYPSVPETFDVRMCKNGDPCHKRGPRGSKGSSDARIPYDLCKEILLALEEFEK